ncbi:MAG TPA: DUF882 domain-containing protein [Pseudolabrys sp.]|nr:DUF882 domain-containing protein [Pseudolabrys sp.]
MSSARAYDVVSSLARTGARYGVAALFAGLFLIGANDSLQTASAEGDTRTISFHHLHTGETITITYKRDGRYDDAALKKLDWFMRDWRKEQSTHMDPHLFDLLWEVNRDVDGKAPIEVICGYRSPGTNAMLRERSSGVAQSSQHINGQAMDFEIPGVPLAKIREIGLRLQRGGVGFYPTSGSPFVHLDTGSVRHWPRMSREQLAKVFPDGRTVHIPSDGEPLKGYALALADIEARGGKPNNVSLAAARDAGIDVAGVEAGAGKDKRSFFARLFGIGKEPDEAQDDAADAEASQKPVSVASLKSTRPPTKLKQVAVQTIVPIPAARPKLVALAQAAPAGGNVIFDTRGVWTRAVESGELLPLTADADPVTTASTGRQALAYAPPDADETLARPSLAPPRAETPRAQAFAPELIGGGQGPDSPWLRAAILTPSISKFMSTTPLGAMPMRPLAELMHKPDQSLVMTFSDDPHLGMVSERFTGTAVVFLATATFTHQQTAALR